MNSGETVAIWVDVCVRGFFGMRFTAGSLCFLSVCLEPGTVLSTHLTLPTHAGVSAAIFLIPILQISN